MTHSERYPSPTLICVSIAAVVACELPGKLGELPGASASAGEGSSSGGEDQGAGDEPTTGEPPPGDGAVCSVEGGLGQLLWSRERDELPHFVTALAATPDGEIAATSTTSTDGLWKDAVVQVYDPAGTPSWTTVYTGQHDFDAWPVDVAVDGAGFVHVLVHEVVSMIETETGGFIDARFVVLRYTPAGEQVWRWEHERPPAGPDRTYWPLGAVEVVGDRIVMLEASPGEAATRSELDAAGTVVAEVELAVPAGAEALRFAVGPDGSAVIGGRFDEPAQGVWAGVFAADGSPGWIDQFGDADDDVELVLSDPAGGAYVAWNTKGGQMVAHHVRRYGSGGAELWTTEVGGTTDDQGILDGAVGCDGRLVLTGGRDMPVTPELELDARQDLWVGRFTADGVWQDNVDHFFGPPFGSGTGVALAVTHDGEVAVAGRFVDSDAELVAWFGRFGG